jgi:hypothetical protein
MTRPTISWPGTITPVPRPLDETGCRDRRRKAGGCYEELAKRFEADGWIVGRVTMEHVVDGVARTPKAVAGDLREIHVADRKGRNVAVAIDPQGKYSCTGGRPWVQCKSGVSQLATGAVKKGVSQEWR